MSLLNLNCSVAEARRPKTETPPAGLPVFWISNWFRTSDLGPRTFLLLLIGLVLLSPWPGWADSASEPLADSINDRARRHWAFQPIRQPSPPPVRTPAWVRSPIDPFILAKLEAAGLSPSPPADRRTLIRRATYDLLGLPPTPEEVEAFLADESQEAYPRLIERLLSSPQYGERWGRYWLDVARYSDTKGYVFNAERLFPYSYTYRDYVIRSFNEDLPFDRFLVEQLAADLVPLGEDKRSLAALGFLTLGRRFLNNAPDIIDDRIDVVSRGTMGLAIGCARCHDHKYHPISIADYYSLYGVFANSNEPEEKPLLGNASLPDAYPEFIAEKNRRTEALESYRRKKLNEAHRQVRRKVGDYLLAAHDAAKLKESDARKALFRERKLDVTLGRQWLAHLEKAESSAIFGPWLALAKLNDFAADAPQTIAALSKADPPVHPAVHRLLTDPPLASLAELAGRYTELFASTDQAWIDLQGQTQTGQPPTHFSDPDQETLRQVLYGADSPLHLGDNDLADLFDIPTREKVRELERNLEKVEATHSGAPPRAMVLSDDPKPRNPHVFLRGNPSRQGPEVPRRFPEFFTAVSTEPFTNGSGRMELALAIVNTNNPLTARVWANRVWMFHFGQPLVSTPSDFGLRAEPPSQLALLDYLASTFMAEGWSTKKLHRLIMLSSAYQQSSQVNARAMQVDSDNQLLWRMNRRRLDFEAMRDTLLAVADQLDLRSYGRSADITTEPFARRRTIYAFIERQNLPGLFRTFDFASPDTTSPMRFDTTVPQQALFLMNSSFAIQQARQLLRRQPIEEASSEDQRLRALWRVAYQRAPEEDELIWGSQFVNTASAPASSLNRWEELAQALLLSNEMFFVD